MKQLLALVVLLGLAVAGPEEPVENLFEGLHQRDFEQILAAFGGPEALEEILPGGFTIPEELDLNDPESIGDYLVDLGLPLADSEDVVALIAGTYAALDSLEYQLETSGDGDTRKVAVEITFYLPITEASMSRAMEFMPRIEVLNALVGGDTDRLQMQSLIYALYYGAIEPAYPTVDGFFEVSQKDGQWIITGFEEGERGLEAYFGL